MITVYEELAPSWVRGQLDALRATYPGWVITYCGFAGDRWLEAVRPGYSGPEPCSLVADLPGMWRALRDPVKWLDERTTPKHPAVQAAGSG